jgi:hypothetical protein
MSLEGGSAMLGIDDQGEQQTVTVLFINQEFMISFYRSVTVHEAPRLPVGNPVIVGNISGSASAQQPPAVPASFQAL